MSFCSLFKQEQRQLSNSLKSLQMHRHRFFFHHCHTKVQRSSFEDQKKNNSYYNKYTPRLYNEDDKRISPYKGKGMN